MSDGKALNEEETQALAVMMAASAAASSLIRKVDWCKTLDLAQRALCYGGANMSESESQKEMLKRFMRDVNAFRVADSALSQSKRACQCNVCAAQQREAN